MGIFTITPPWSLPARQGIAKLGCMPELPEAECVRQTLTPQLINRKVASVRVNLAKIARPDPASYSKGIRGRTVIATSRHGKMLLIHLDNGSFWNIHLGMTGQVILAEKRPRAKHIHITVGFRDKGPKLYYRDMRQFGFMGYWPDEETLRKVALKNFGPDALLISKDEFVKALSFRKAPIKSLLLDQRILAGIGNIYADESLHRAGISPLAKPAELSSRKLGILHQQIQVTLKDALAKGGSSVRNFVDAEGRAGTFQHAHLVYQRGGQACSACGETIKRVVVAGRSTHYCPCCQS
jgi:formamidopyrimidine-DNA glycosylase